MRWIVQDYVSFGFQDNKHQIDWYLLMFVCEVCLSETSNDIQKCVVEKILLCHIMLVVLTVEHEKWFIVMAE
jgi:hypothetical protein